MPGRKTVTFGDNGETISEGEEQDAPVAGEEEEVEEEAPEGEEPDEGTEGEEGEAPEGDEEGEEPPPVAQGKYRIGDKYFKTEKEALAYANGEQSTPNPLDAYRQGVQDVLSRAAEPESVTPQDDDDFDEEAYYADPKKYLREREQKVIAKATQTISQQQAEAQTANQVWNEFSNRHPDLAEFRAEVEAFVAQNKDSVIGVIKKDGRPAGYDYIALKMKSNFQRYADAAKPKRELKNKAGGASPTGTRSGVTPKPKAEKTLSFAEQVAQRRVR